MWFSLVSLREGLFHIVKEGNTLSAINLTKLLLFVWKLNGGNQFLGYLCVYTIQQINFIKRNSGNAILIHPVLCMWNINIKSLCLLIDLIFNQNVLLKSKIQK